MTPPSTPERVAVIRALLAAVEAELDMIESPVIQSADRPATFNKNLIEQDVCPECGINWREPSPSCPRLLFNRHRLA